LVADSFEVQCEADEGGACKKDVAISSYEYEENNLTKEDHPVEDPLVSRQLARGCGVFAPSGSGWVVLVAF
jgi:hypothetical protein